jgi:hypothetical protein
MAMIPTYIQDLLKLEYPHTSISPLTTPVLGFGNFRNAKFATLGINPSRAEFFDKNHKLLTGSKRRLATSESLGGSLATRRGELAFQSILQDCENYFMVGKNYYRRWFNPLNAVLRQATDSSYLEGTACHIDLLPWATSKIWKELDQPERHALVRAGKSYLTSLLKDAQYKVILINGRTVIRAFTEHCSEFSMVSSHKYKNISYDMVRGNFQDAIVVGWSVNLQSSFGVTKELRSEIADRARQLMKA